MDGIVYHLVYFTAINKAAYLFGSLFIVQGLLFAYFGMRDRLSFWFERGWYGILGGVLMLFALLIYPLIGYFNGHIYPAAPTFGLPCPTTIFTFGMFLLSDRKLPVTLLVIPFLWSIIGFMAAFSLGISEDAGLLVSGLISVSVIVLRNRKKVVAYPASIPAQENEMTY